MVTETTGQIKDGHPLRDWLEVASVAAGIFSLVTTEFLPVGLLTDIAADFRVSDGVAGYMVTVPGLVAAISAPTLVLAAKAIDRKIILLMLTGLVVLSNIIVITAPTFAVALAARILLGISVGGAWTFGVPIARRLVTERHAHRATAVVIAGISIATVFGVPLGTLIGQTAGWRAAFGATGAFALLVLLVQIVLLRRLPAERALRLRDIVAISRIPAGRAGLVAIALLVAGHFAAFTYLTPFLENVTGASSNTVTAVLLIYGVAGLLGTFLGERAAARSILRSYVGVAFIVGATLIAAAILGRQPALAIVLITIWGAAFGAVPVEAQIWMHDASPQLFEGGSALFVATFQIAIGVGSLIGGVVIDSSAVIGALIVGGSLSMAAAASLLLYAARNPGSASPRDTHS